MKLSILVVHENPSLIEPIIQILKKNGYNTLRCSASAEVFDVFRRTQIDIVLQSIKMPKIMDSDLFMKILEASSSMPIIMLCAMDEISLSMDAIKRGAFDFTLVNPIDEAYLLRIISKAASHVRSKQLQNNFAETLQMELNKRSQELNETIAYARLNTRDMVQRLLTAAEFRDDETGNHVKRIGSYATVFAAVLNMEAVFKESIAVASSMHDIGKIGIPDAILLKTGPLTAQEFDYMKKHTIIGHKILSGSQNAYLQMAANIALSHHERFDGSGYPQGLQGEAIPFESRIVMICDQYDALRSQRPFKAGFDHAKTMEILTKGDGRTIPDHFDPRIRAALPKVAPILEKLFDANK